MATTTKIIDIDAVRNAIHKVLDNWKKKFEEFFVSHENYPPIADPPQPELTTLTIAYKGGAPHTPPTISISTQKSAPNFFPADASKGSLDGTSSATNLDEMRQQLINLDEHLQAIEQAADGNTAITDIQTRLDQEYAINNLKAETKQIVITTGKSFLNNKMEEPHSSNTT
jgi:hypothetical protein